MPIKQIVNQWTCQCFPLCASKFTPKGKQVDYTEQILIERLEEFIGKKLSAIIQNFKKWNEFLSGDFDSV